MSIHCISWAWKVHGLTPAQGLVLLALADHANAGGYCWPSLTRLSMMSRLHRSTVARVLNALEEMNLIERSRGHRGYSTSYQLNMDEASVRSENDVCSSHQDAQNSRRDDSECRGQTSTDTEVLYTGTEKLSTDLSTGYSKLSTGAAELSTDKTELSTGSRITPPCGRSGSRTTQSGSRIERLNSRIVPEEVVASSDYLVAVEDSNRHEPLKRTVMNQEREGTRFSNATTHTRNHSDALKMDGGEKKETASEPELVTKDAETRPPKGTRLPDDWKPSDEDIDYALAKGMTLPDAEETAARYRDHWRSAVGWKAMKADWSATWRNWVRGDTKAAEEGTVLGKRRRSKIAECRNVLEDFERRFGDATATT